MSSLKDKWVFFSVLPPFRGGISKFSHETLRALSKTQNVKAFTFRKQYPDFLFPGTTQFDQQPMQENFERIVSTFNPLSYFVAARRIQKEKPSVFVTSYWMTFMAPMMAFWSYLLPQKTKKIAIIHNLVPHEKRFFDRAFNLLFLNTYDAFVVLSEAVKNEVLTLKPQAKVIVLGHPPYDVEGGTLTNIQARENLGLDPNKKTLLFFGLIRSYKGLKELITAFSLLDDSYQLLIAGEVYGDDKPYLEQLERLPHHNWKFVNQYIPEEEVGVYFSAADLVVLPYLSATQSGIRAMALAQKRAVLCTNVGGLAEDLEKLHQGFELHDTAPVSFSDRIQVLFNQGDISRCNAHLAVLNLELDTAWLQFAKGLIHLAEEA